MKAIFLNIFLLIPASSELQPCGSELSLKFDAEIKRLSFTGYNPVINRIESLEKKIVLTGYFRDPTTNINKSNGIIEITAGELCNSYPSKDNSMTSSAVSHYGSVSWLISGIAKNNVLGFLFFVALSSLFLESNFLPSAMAEVCEEKSLVVEIYAPSNPMYGKDNYYVGSWIGTDPVDGAQLERSIVPGKNGTILYTARNEAAGACGSSAENGQVIGLVNPIEGTVGKENKVTFYVNFTCYGDESPKFSGVPVYLAPFSNDIIVETIGGYSNPIYLHRVSPYYLPFKMYYDEYYVGSWMGVDPVDGAQLQRSIVPVGDGKILYTARNEASGACGSSAESGKIIGLVNPSEGKVTEDSTVTFNVNFTCYGDDEPKFSGVPVSLEPMSENIIIETIRGYPSPIYLHRVSS